MKPLEYWHAFSTHIHTTWSSVILETYHYLTTGSELHSTITCGCPLGENVNNTSFSTT